MNWVSTQTRPDMSFYVGELGSKIKCALVQDLIYANKVLAHLKRSDLTMAFSGLSDLKTATIECFSDASFGNLPNGGSQGGYIIFLADQMGKRSPVTWQSRKIRRVVRSTLAAEMLALLDAAEAGVLLGETLKQVLGVTSTIKCYVDNRSLVDAAYSTTNIEDKMLRISVAALRDMIRQQTVHCVEWIRSTHQIANPLTKKGASNVELLKSISQ